MSTRRVVGGSLVLLAANVAGGLGNYYFQLRGAARLPVAGYGALNVWMAQLSIALVSGALAQYAANFRPRAGPALRRAALAGAAVSIAALAATAGLAAVADPRLALFAVTLVAGITYLYLFGQLQAHTRFAAMGVSLLIGAAIKVGLTFTALGARPETAYYAAVGASLAASCLVAAVLLVATEPRDHAIPAHSGEGRAISTAVLALATAILPQLDLINLRSAHGDVVLGEFARASLFAKALYFGALTLLQVTLPYHLLIARGASREVARRVHALELLGLGGCVAASIASFWVAPPVSRLVLGIELTAEHRAWVVLSCLCLTALWGHLQVIQVACALGRWRVAGARLAALAATVPAFALFPRPSVTDYLTVAIVWYAVVHIVLFTLSARRRPATRARW